MKIQVDKINQYIKQLKELLKIEKANRKHLEVSGDWQANPKARNAARNKLETNHEHAERIAHELHCLAVEMGFASYDSERYGEKLISGSEGEKLVYRRSPSV